MKRRIAKVLMPAYAFVRSLASPLVWRIFYYRRRFINDETRRLLKRFLKSSMDDASLILERHPYKADRIHGLVDASIPAKHAPAFFACLPWGRDCDEYADPMITEYKWRREW